MIMDIKQVIDINEYLGMRFIDWCRLDEDDITPMIMNLDGHIYNSNQEVSYSEMYEIQQSTIIQMNVLQGNDGDIYYFRLRGRK